MIQLQLQLSLSSLCHFFQIVTKARVVATIGYHEIYKIEEVILIPLAIQGIPVNNPDELRYLKLFQVSFVIHLDLSLCKMIKLI